MAWAMTARPDQRPPIENENDGDYVDWNIWLLMGGRGSGKTRAGAEWVRERALGLHDGVGDKPPVRIALVAPTLVEARSVMVEGVSGLLALDWAAEERPVFEVSRRLITWPNGSQAQIFSAEEPDSLRGPQFHAGWCDGQMLSLHTLTLQTIKCCFVAWLWGIWIHRPQSILCGRIGRSWTNSADFRDSTVED